MFCKDCANWDKSGSTGSCLSPKLHSGYSVSDDAILPDGWLVENDEGWGMDTAPEFGCVHFIKKEK